MKQMGTVVIQEEAGREEIQVLSLLLLCESHGNPGGIQICHGSRSSMDRVAL